jgi:predicted transcriptional regulator
MRKARKKKAGKAHKDNLFSKDRPGVMLEQERGVAGCFDDKELLYLAALMRGPMTLDELAYATGIDTKKGFGSLNDLQTMRLVKRGEKKDKSTRKYYITARGKKIVGTFGEEGKFMEIQKQIR